ncbi:serine/threonine protein kinase [Nonomuraea sp. NN258]|uniref:serine/threonine-protein kinase n=1 Tax=Nonomuraea antri TaxID=2730852 RepID=UPI00156986D1|nr:serine/threonine-protein kinase [Nonomuraea antri]NRQ36539.1 serine/threonine protein kinase [Nonomuraea antri]
MHRQVSNRYRLIEPLGEGGMGVVWRAYDELLDRTVAIKEVRYAGVGDTRRAELNGRTIREARAAGRLDHPSVIVIHDVIEEDGRPWIVMQLVRSRSLAQVVREFGPLPVEQVASIGGRLLDALRAAHATGVLHRDVKPENVLLADDGRVVLTDFGIASMEAEAGLTATGGLVGTPAYMPPERLNGEPARPESDLWALGATLYTAVEGRPPYQGESWPAVVAAVLRDAPAPPVRAGALAPVIMGLLRRDPAARIPADQAAHLLHEAAADPHRTVPLRRADKGRAGRWKIVVPAVAATAVLAAGGTLLAVQGGSLWDGTPAGSTSADGTSDGTSDATRTGAAPPPPETSTAEPTDTTDTTPDTTPSETQEPTPSDTPEPTPSETGGPVRVPPGWSMYTNADGRFSIALPKGWRPKPHPTRDSVSVTGPGTLIVEWTVPEKPWTNARSHWLGVERDILDRNEFEGYRRVRLESLTYLGRDAADWEFTRIREGRRIHVVNRGFRTADGRPYALYWETTESSWRANRHYFDTLTETFRPR